MPKKPYHLSHVLKCEFHVLWYETECSARATDAEKVIDPRLGKSHSNMPKATFSVLIRLFCQIHHFPRNSSAPLPNPQRFLPNHWFIANFCKFIIFCKKKSSSCHLPHLLCSYLLFPSYWQLPRSHSHHIELSPQLWFICAKFFTFQRVSFPMLLKFLLPLVNSHQTLLCQSQIHLFPGGFAWLITEFLQTRCQMHHFQQIRLVHHIFPRSLALAKLDHFAIFLIASFSWRISKKHLDLMDQQSQQSLNPPWKIAGI